MIRAMRRLFGIKGSKAMGAVVDGADLMWNPGSLRAREQLDEQHHASAPAPAPGDGWPPKGFVLPTEDRQS